MATLIAGVGALFKGAGIGGLLSAGGTVLSTVGAIKSGKAAGAAAEYNAQQLEAAGKAENAAAQREAVEQRRQKELVLSRARVVGAASGGGQDFNLLGQIEEEGELNAMNALWQGEEAAKGRRAQAASSRFEGAQAKRAGKVRGFGTLLAGGSSFLEQYG